MNTATVAKKSPSPGRMLLEEISREERRRIRKRFPFSAIRNRTIYELWKRGAWIIALAEASGLNRSVVGRIIKAERAKEERAGV